MTNQNYKKKSSQTTNKCEDYNWLNHIKINGTPITIGRTKDVLSWILRNNNNNTNENTSKCNNRLYQWHFFTYYRDIVNDLVCSEKTVDRCIRKLKDGGIIKVYRSTRATKIWINYELLNELKKQPKDIMTEKEKIKEETIGYLNEVKELLPPLANEEMKEATHNAINNIASIQVNNDISHPEQKEMACQNEVIQHQEKITEIRQNTDTNITKIDEIKDTILTSNDIRILEERFNRDLSDFYYYMKNGLNVYAKKYDNDTDRVGEIYVCKNNDITQNRLTRSFFHKQYDTYNKQNTI